MERRELLAGFDDPEVMAAVAEVAANPQAFERYKANPKVRYACGPANL